MTTTQTVKRNTLTLSRADLLRWAAADLNIIVAMLDPERTRMSVARHIINVIGLTEYGPALVQAVGDEMWDRLMKRLAKLDEKIKELMRKGLMPKVPGYNYG